MLWLVSVGCKEKFWKYWDERCTILNNTLVCGYLFPSLSPELPCFLKWLLYSSKQGAVAEKELQIAAEKTPRPSLISSDPLSLEIRHIFLARCSLCGGCFAIPSNFCLQAGSTVPLLQDSGEFRGVRNWSQSWGHVWNGASGRGLWQYCLHHSRLEIIHYFLTNIIVKNTGTWGF